MDITVKKFGGSSLASATGIKRCAATVADTASKGCAVVVVVSAMGTSTDHLSEMLSQFCPNSRESDVVLSSGEQVSAGLFAAALFDLGIKAESLLGWQVPIFTDSTHSCAKVVGVGVDLIMQKLQSGTIPVIAGFQDQNRNRCSVTSMQIPGIVHEFSSLPGVREDLPDVILNIKSLVLPSCNISNAMLARWLKK